MPGRALVMEGAMQHAPHPLRHAIKGVKLRGLA
jgi:hypothetical protein